ncbi:MAG: UDP-N-acetylmuramate--L-alanine ligase [Chloroflexi bacterium]|nr:UDP-N-acetylmuramate--L-alanine ligase [Chloroflexota bacterium]
MANPRQVHFVGIGGIHMSGLARILLEDGVRVTGSDLVASAMTEGLMALGAEIDVGHDASHVTGAELVVRTVAVGDDNPEIVAARSGGIELISRAEMVARIAQGHRALTVAGSHGKTTTSTMLAFILREAGQEPSFILGGESPDLGTHATRGRGDLIVLEADEYGRAFHEYEPSVAVITNLERDHLDFYGSDEALQEAFVLYAATLVANGTLLVGGESPCAARVAERLARDRDDIAIETFGLATAGSWTWSAADIQRSPDSLEFRVLHDDAVAGTVTLGVPGDYNVRNALAAAAVALSLGTPFDGIATALGGFRGVSRRFQLQGEKAGVTVIDDYAHHPTEIAATIQAAHERYPGRRLVVLFQPHTYSRSQYLLEGFQRCFEGVDRLNLTATYAARERPEQGLPAIDLADRIETPKARYLGELPAAAHAVAQAARAGDVIFTMGAGDVDAAGRLILDGLETA